MIPLTLVKRMSRIFFLNKPLKQMDTVCFQIVWRNFFRSMILYVHQCAYECVYDS
jgi:hypothetical protein